MIEEIVKQFGQYPAQVKVARLMLRLGLKVHSGNIFCGEVKLADVAVGKAAGVDRRVVRATAMTISNNPTLSNFFGRLEPVANLSSVARSMGWSTLEIASDDATQPGILADVARIIAEAGISVRQAIVEDPELTESPRIFVVTSAEVPASIIPALRNAKGVREITLR